MQKGWLASIRPSDWKDSNENRQRCEFSVASEKLGIPYFYPGLMVIKTFVCLDLACE